jgi:hypothetical protein
MIDCVWEYLYSLYKNVNILLECDPDLQYISLCGIGKVNKTPIIYGLVGFLGFDYILSQMFYGTKVNLCVWGVKGGYEWKPRDKACWVNKKKKKKCIYFYLLLIGMDCCLAREPGPLIITKLTVALTPPYSQNGLAYVKLYIALFDSMTVTKRHLGFYTVYREKGMSVTLYALHTKAAPTPCS